MNVETIMSQAAVMQQRVLELQTSLDSVEVTGVAGDGLIRYTCTGRKVPLRIEVDDRLFEMKDRVALEQLVMMALHDADGAADRMVSESTAQLLAELGVPQDQAGLPA